MPPAVIPNHAHCAICGRAIQFGDKYCGPECSRKAEAEAKQRRKMMLIMYALLGVGVLLLFVGPFLGGGQ